MNEENRLTRDELLNIVVALNSMAYRESQEGNNKEADTFRALKWKVFNIMSETKKEG